MTFGSLRFARHRGKRGNLMRNAMNVKSETDWERVKLEAASDAPIPFNAEDELYDPNDEAPTDAFLNEAAARRGKS